MARTWTREHAINLQTRRKAQRWTLDQLASKANLTVEVVQQLERADEMDLDDEEVLRQLALALGVLPKQLCNSPLRPNRKPTDSPTAVAADSTNADQASGGTNGRPGMWAIATVAVLIIAAAFLPRACDRISAPDVPEAAVAPKATAPATVAPVSNEADRSTGDSDAGEEPTKEANAAAITALIADLATPTPAIASQQLVAALDQPMDSVREALNQQATDPKSPVTERLVMILILNGSDGPMLRESLTAFLQQAIAANDGALPWPAGSIESAIAMGAAEDVTGAAPAIEAYLDDAGQLPTDRSALKAAIDRAHRGQRKEPAASEPVPNLLDETTAATAPLPRQGTDLLQVETSSDGEPQTIQNDADADADVEADPLGRFTVGSARPPADAAAVATVLQQARDAAEAGHVAEVRSELAEWLKSVPAEWITISNEHPDLWRMLGWTLFPGDAPMWEQAFGVDEERWMILVVAKLLDGAAA